MWFVSSASILTGATDGDGLADDGGLDADGSPDSG